MTKKEFLDAVNEIDDEFINEIIDIPGDISEKPQENYFADGQPRVVHLTNECTPLEPQKNYFSNEQPQKVYLTDKPVPFWKIAASTAATICVLAVGIFTAANIHGINAYSPNESGSSENSIYVSDNVSNSAPTTSEKLDLSERDGGSAFEINISEKSTEPIYISTVTKQDNEQYATVQFDSKNIFSLGVFRDGKCMGRQTVSGEGLQTLYIDYFEPVEIGDELVLGIWSYNSAWIDGQWVP